MRQELADHEAALRHWRQVVRKEVGVRCWVDARRGLSGETPLHAAALHGNARALRLLVDAGADVEAQTSDGWTPLHYALAADGDLEGIRHQEAVEVLLFEAEADPDARIGESAGGDGMPGALLEASTALHVAAASGVVERVAAVLDAGADHALTDCDERTALFVAARGGFIRAVQLLLERGADPRPRSGITFEKAADAAASPLIRQLLDDFERVTFADSGADTVVSSASFHRLVRKWRAKAAQSREDRDRAAAVAAEGTEGGDMLGALGGDGSGGGRGMTRADREAKRRVSMAAGARWVASLRDSDAMDPGEGDTSSSSDGSDDETSSSDGSDAYF